MSSFKKLGKKLLPARKAWKSFTNTIQSKLRNLKIPKSFNNTTTLLLVSTCRRALHSFIHRCRRHLNPRRRHYHPLEIRASSAIYVDQLFPEPTIMNTNKEKQVLECSRNGSICGGDNKGNVVEATKIDKNKVQKNETWKVSYNLQQFKGVDERAEEFISNFRQDMKLQREQSILDYQEMLARGV